MPVNIADIGRAVGVEVDPEQLKQNVIQYYRNRPGFFAPYQNGRDVLDTLTSPFVIPLGGVVISGLVAAATGVAAAVCVCSFIAAGIAAAAKQVESRNTALTVATISGIGTLLAPLLSALVVVLAVIATADAIARLVTRTGATIVNPLATAIQSCCPPKASEGQDEAGVPDEAAPLMTP